MFEVTELLIFASYSGFAAVFFQTMLSSAHAEVEKERDMLRICMLRTLDAGEFDAAVLDDMVRMNVNDG